MKIVVTCVEWNILASRSLILSLPFEVELEYDFTRTWIGGQSIEQNLSGFNFPDDFSDFQVFYPLPIQFSKSRVQTLI